MKTCPFCYEEIRDQAIKCRYCSSSLLPPQPSSDPAGAKSTSENQIIYVFDKGLIRFGKFVVAAIALIAAVGVLFYGIDIKNADDDVRKIRDDARDTVEKVKQTTQELNDAREKLEAANTEAKALLQSLHEKAEEAGNIVAHLQQGPPPNTGEGTSGTSGGATSSSRTGFLPSEIARLYNFPAELEGRGQTIALIELGGGYFAADLNSYFSQLKLHAPSVKWVGVDGARNTPSKGEFGSTAEVTMNIELAAGIAPRANIVVYFAPNTNNGFLDAITRAVQDQQNKPSIIVITWGGPESNYTAASREAFNAAFQQAANSGITVVTAAGDGGSSDSLTDGAEHVDFPASSPFVLACGVTSLKAEGEQIKSEVVWSDKVTATGGGASDFFPPPPWQSKPSFAMAMNGRKGRGIPDVAASGDPAIGYRIFVNGRFEVIGGSAATAAVWGGLIARLNQGLGRNLGYFNPQLYDTIGPSGAFRDITSGSNGVRGNKGYAAGPGWDAVSGWGSPNGQKLINALKALPR